MAKKSRSRRPQQGARLHTATSTHPTAPTHPGTARTATATPSTTPRPIGAQPRPLATRREAPAPVAPVDFASEYHYVLADLKRLGILATAMFATLVVLALAL